jgi:hypothetical protein
MSVPGEELPGVFKATEFLIRANVDPDLLPLYSSLRPSDRAGFILSWAEKLSLSEPGILPRTACGRPCAWELKR